MGWSRMGMVSGGGGGGMLDGGRRCQQSQQRNMNDDRRLFASETYTDRDNWSPLVVTLRGVMGFCCKFKVQPPRPRKRF